jgi:hypothetical protein
MRDKQLLTSLVIGNEESSNRFMKPIYDRSLRQPVSYVVPKRFCDSFSPTTDLLNGEGISVAYRILKKSDDGYVWLTDPQYVHGKPSDWDGICLWVNLQVWNIQSESK